MAAAVAAAEAKNRATAEGPEALVEAFGLLASDKLLLKNRTRTLKQDSFQAALDALAASDRSPQK